MFADCLRWPITCFRLTTRLPRRGGRRCASDGRLWSFRQSCHPLTTSAGLPIKALKCPQPSWRLNVRPGFVILCDPRMIATWNRWLLAHLLLLNGWLLSCARKSLSFGVTGRMTTALRSKPVEHKNNARALACLSFAKPKQRTHCNSNVIPTSRFKNDRLLVLCTRVCKQHQTACQLHPCKQTTSACVEIDSST